MNGKTKHKSRCRQHYSTKLQTCFFKLICKWLNFNNYCIGLCVFRTYLFGQIVFFFPYSSIFPCKGRQLFLFFYSAPWMCWPGPPSAGESRNLILVSGHAKIKISISLGHISPCQVSQRCGLVSFIVSIIHRVL